MKKYEKIHKKVINRIVLVTVLAIVGFAFTASTLIAAASTSGENVNSDTDIGLQSNSNDSISASDVQGSNITGNIIGNNTGNNIGNTAGNIGTINTQNSNTQPQQPQANIGTDINTFQVPQTQLFLQTQGTWFVDMFESFYQFFMKLSLPVSLDSFYQNQKPEIPGNKWLDGMISQAGAFEGIATNLQEGDFANATRSYNAFASTYKNLSTGVPEWQGYFDISAVDKLGSDLNAKDINASFNDMGIIGETCGRCHGDHQPQVWAKYYWKNFDTVNISTPQGNLSWTPGMFALAGAFDGIGINLAEGKKTEANTSFNQFKLLYKNTKEACKSCHDTPRYYYVSDDVFKQIDQLGQNVTSGNVQNAQILQQQLSVQCYKCHVLHIPAQDMKDKLPESK